MLQRPRRVINVSSLRNTAFKQHSWCYPPTGFYILKLNVTTKLSWRHFEALRLKIARALAKQRRGGKKAFFKQKTTRRKIRRRVTLRAHRHLIPKLAWYNGFPHLPYIIKTKGSRMGKGKGNPQFWYYKGYPGQILFLLNLQNPLLAQNLLRKLRAAIPGHTCLYYIKRTREHCLFHIHSELLVIPTIHKNNVTPISYYYSTHLFKPTYTILTMTFKLSWTLLWWIL